MTTSLKVISERLSPVEFTAGAVSESGVLRGVVICGLKSANNRVYPADVLRKAVAKYEGANVYLDHTGPRDARGVQEWFGELRNIRSRPDGRPEGDLHYDPTHEFAKTFEGRAKNFPRSLGLSHVAECQTRRGADGHEIVESIDRVVSVDLVASPATNTSIHESTGGRTVGKISLKEFVELRGPKWGPAKWGAAKKLCEEFPDMAAAPVVDAPADDAPADDPADLKTALMSALWPIVEAAFDDGSSAKAESALRDFIKMHAKHTGTGKDDTSADTDTDDDPTTPEGKRPNLAGLVAECRAKQFAATGDDLAVLSEIRTPEGRALVIDRLKDAARPTGETPRSSGRPVVREGTTPDPKAAPTMEEIKKRIRA